MKNFPTVNNRPKENKRKIETQNEMENDEMRNFDYSTKQSAMKSVG